MTDEKMTLKCEKKNYFICTADDMDEFICHNFCRNYSVREDEQLDEDGVCVWIFPDRDNQTLISTITEIIRDFMNGGNGRYKLFYLLYYLCLKETIPEGIYVVVEKYEEARIGYGKD